MQFLKKHILNIYILLFLALLHISCEERIDSSLLSGEPVLTINALITDQKGPYYVRITKSSSDLQKEFNIEQGLAISRKFEAINNATVTMNDDQGNIDTLEFWNVNLTENPSLGEWIDQGIYRTKHLQGVAGRTYTLTVVYEGKVYQSVATIPSSPPTINEVKYTRSQDPINDSRVPLVSFEESQNYKNYYRFFYIPYSVNSTTNELTSIGGWSDGPNNFWQLVSPQIFIFDDQLLPAKVKNLKLEDDGITSQELPSPNSFSPAIKIKVEIQIHSISKEAYEYFSSIKEQLLFTPNRPFSSAPASPPTNISNGGLGFFSASSVKSILIDGPQN
ncbi:MAG TPA: hypothetical protein DCS93_16845 [Microscillaceae bacterium]|nr:hypothetical protein [Microscillaceae bacterium]